MALEMSGEARLRLVAIKRGVPVEEVKAAIEASAQEAMETCKRTNNKAGLELWERITGGTGKCSAEQLIEFLSAYANELQG